MSHERFVWLTTKFVASLLIVQALLAITAQAHVIRKRENNETTATEIPIAKHYAATSVITSDANSSTVVVTTTSASMALNDPDIVTKNFQIQSPKQSTPSVLNASNTSESVSKSLTMETDSVRDVMNVNEDKLKLQSIDIPETEETTIKTTMNGRFDSTAAATATTVGMSIMPTKATKLSMLATNKDVPLQQHTNSNITSELSKLIKLEPISNTIEDNVTIAGNINVVKTQLQNNTMLSLESGTKVDDPLLTSATDDLNNSEQQPVARSMFDRNDDLFATTKNNLQLIMSTINASSATTTTEPALATKLQTESTTTTALPELLMSTTTEMAIAANEIVQQVTITHTLTTTPTPTPTTTTTTIMPALADLIAAAGTTMATTTATQHHSHENIIEAVSNEIQHRATSGSGNGSGSEKRAKFINDNSTNALQLNLPDTAEVWTLAGMKMVPKQNQTQMQQIIVIAQSTEEPAQNNTLIISNSEKNLLDWTQIMLHSDLSKGKKFEKLMTEEKYDSDSDAKTEAKPTITNAIDEEITQMPFADSQVNMNKVDESLNILGTTTTTTTTTVAYAATTPNPIEREEIRLQFVPISTINPMTFKYEHDNEEEKMSTTTTKPLPPVIATTTTTTTTTAPTHIPFIMSTLADNDKRTTTAATLSNDNKNNFSKIAETTTTATTTVTIAGNPIESESTTMENNNGMQLRTTTALTPLLLMSTAYPEVSAFPKLHANTQPQTIEQTTTTIITEATTMSAQAKTDLTLSSNKTKIINTNEDGNDAGSNSDVSDATVRLEENSSETTTLSMPAASEFNGTSSARDSLLTVNEIETNENNVNTATTIATETETKTKTAIKAIENLPFALDRDATTTKEPITIITTTTTEANKDIQNEVINLKSEATSTKEILIDVTTTIANKTTIATTTATPFLTNESLDTTTAATIITTTATTNTQQSTTPKEIQEEILEKSQKQNELKEETEETLTGSNGIFNTTITPVPTAITTTATTTAVVEDDTILNENGRAIESNVIQAFDKDKPTTSTTTTTTAAASTATTSTEATTAAFINRIQQNATGANETHTLVDDEHLDAEDVENAILTTTTINDIMATINTITKTTNPNAIEIDETTAAISSELPTLTTTTASSPPLPITTTPASIATKLQEVYTVITTTTTTARITTTTSPSTDQSNFINTLDYSELSPSKTTMLPQINNTATTTMPPNVLISPANDLHATINSGDTSSSMLPDNLRPNPASDATGGTDVNVIIAITVSVVGVVALILLVAFLYLMRKRQKQMSYSQRCRPVSLDAYSLDNVSVLGSVRRKSAYRASKRTYGNAAFDDPSLRHNILNATELAKFIERRSSIFEEFRDVPQIIARADEVPPGCEDKNRYANVVPLPETRVILQQQGDDEKTEYINANYVRGPRDPPNYYIACQAPLETTVADFWRMIWEQQSRVIVQATDLIENGIEKCAEYLPPSVTLDNHTTYGDFQVTLKNREVKDKYAISIIMLKHTVNEESRELTHYWYKWPETGVPNEEAPIIAMLLEARSSLKTYAIEQANELKEKSSTLTGKSMSDKSDSQLSPTGTNSLEQKEGNNSMSGSTNEINGNLSADKLRATANQGPLTVHCSPGTGRTGTIIACDMAIRSLETPKRCLDIPQLVYYVRRGRASAVQTKEQYEFIYKVAHMYATKITNLSNEN